VTHALVLQLLIEMVKLANEVVKNIPAEKQANFWERHEKRVEKWEAIFDGVHS
jgi:hypothetical protein